MHIKYGIYTVMDQKEGEGLWWLTMYIVINMQSRYSEEGFRRVGQGTVSKYAQ